MANSTEVSYGFGQMGSIHVAGTNAVTIIGGLDSNATPASNVNRTTKVFVAITFDADGGVAVDGETFPKGVTIYGRWTGFQLATGRVIAYVGY